ncbi:MAG: WYL domain-containing protein [Bacteroides sp.]|nr:WYL domain-containing protein [Bacteroides sp.]
MEEGVTIEQIIKRAIEDGLTLEIDYAKNSLEKSSRVISNIKISQEYGVGYISAFCHMKREERTFKISRIVDARIVPNPNRRTIGPQFNHEFDASKPIFNLYGEEDEQLSSLAITKISYFTY